MPLLFTLHAGVVLLGMALLALNTWQQSLSFGLGGALMIANVALLAFVWSRLLKKKLIALGLLIIVTKYALLGVVLYKTFDIAWVEPLFFALGVGSFGLAAAVFGMVSTHSLTELQRNT